MEHSLKLGAQMFPCIKIQYAEDIRYQIVRQFRAVLGGWCGWFEVVITYPVFSTMLEMLEELSPLSLPL